MRRPRDPGLVLHAAAEAPPEAPSMPGAGDQALAAALARCAAGDPAGLDELRRWQGGRLRQVLQRMLGDERLTDSVLETALDDIRRNAAMLDALGRGPPEDRVFGLLRRHAYAAMRARQPEAMPSETAPPPPAPAWPRPVAQDAAAGPPPAVPPFPPRAHEVEPAPAAEEDGPPMPGLRPAGVATPMAAELRPRRAGVTERGVAPWPDSEADEDETPRRRWPRLLLAWVLAGAVGFALAYLGIVYLTRPGDLSALLPPRATVSPAPPETSLGPPLEASEPASVDPALPTPAPSELAPIPPPEPTPRPAPLPARPVTPSAAREPAATPPAERTFGTATAPLPAQARIFIHHSAGDAAATTRARALAQRLQEQGGRTVVVRSVPFAIRGLSVRFFHDGDRAAAGQTLAVAEGLLGMSDHVPADFTSFSPPPRPGTIEVWLPGG